ncbi:MAG TPA: DUF1801 domain-containing protein [Acidimicrobiia bacterium]|nr:DUF1801 domain-containing protein [Acidimicrobiia bacterium]
MERTDRNVDDFLAELPEAAREDMVVLDRTIAAVMSGHPRVLYTGTFWGGSAQEIIGYGELTNQRPGKPDVEWFIVGLALQKAYISLYISAVEERQYLSEKYGHELGKVKVGKSSISFKRVADIDLDGLAALVTRAREITEAG